MYNQLSFLVHWPKRPDLMKTMPSDFRKLCFNHRLFSCVLIIDCFEVFIERPASLLAKAQTYSNYKKHNTIFLIGITPQGSLAYISKGEEEEYQMSITQRAVDCFKNFCPVI